MDLMRLAAKITLDDDSFKSGIRNAESMGERLQGKMSAMTIAVGNLVTDVIRRSVSGIQSIIGGAIDGYADYQQLIGGVETLFKSSADKVSAYARESFRTTGLSANDYMETVTSFSASLLQGLKGDTDAAAELANTAIQDMADNANKMGTDISSIQTAYQGFAKQNYTMLDNLKLGYGGTREEMVRLVNDSGILDHEIKDLDGITFDQLIQAIHEIQTEMGITGTTAKEAAETISGSKSSLVAAWEDLMAAVGGANITDLDTAVENFKTSFSTYMTNLLPTLTATVANSGTLINAIADSIAALPTDALANLASGAAGTVEGLADGAKTLTHWIVESITELFRQISADPSEIASMGQAIGEFIGSALSDIVSAAPTLVSGLFTAGVTLAGSLIEGLFAGLFGTDDGVDAYFKDVDKEMMESIKNAEESSTKAEGIIEYMESLVEKYGDAAKNTEEWANAMGRLEEVLPGATDYIKAQNTPLETTIRNLQQLREELRLQAIETAKQKALADKQEYYYQLLAEKTSLETDIDIAQRAQKSAAANIEAFANAYFTKYGMPGMNAMDYQENPEALMNELKFILTRTTDEAGNYIYQEGTESYNQMLAQLESWVSTVTGTDDEIETLQNKVKALEEQIAIAETKYLAASQRIDEMAAAAANAAGNLATLAIVKPGLGNLTGGFGLTGQFDTPGVTFMPRAVGIDYAPEGFRAQLHQGEAILTKEDNQRRMSGYGGIDEMEQALENAIERSMSRLYINMSGEKVADITTRRTGQNISGNEHARMRAVGG